MPTEVDQAKDPFWLWLGRKHGGLRYRLYKVKQRLFRRAVATPAEYDAYLWGKRIGKIDFASKVNMFSDYMDKCSACQPYVEEKTDAQPKVSGAHWAQSVLSALVAKCGYDMETALNVPISRALADFLKHAESEGTIRLLPSEALQ